MIKQHYINLKNSINNSNSTKDTNKKKIPENSSENNNDLNSMNANTSQIDIESSNIEESDFNYIIKEYNKNILETEEKNHHK
jgi:hypothetical protein